MLHQLKYDVTFAITNRKISEEILFERGFGTITGPNESGKSFMLEMIRWLLFGAKALRGSLTDYKKLSGFLKFSVKGETYEVTRTINSATLKHGNKVIAVGTKPVNIKIAIGIFGFGLEVFDVACIVNQSELEKLGDMQSSDRKRMVDSVIGLAAIDDLSKMANDFALENTREAESLKKNLIKPIEPVKPEGYVHSSLMAVTLGTFQKLENTKSEIEGRLSIVIERPIAPDPCLHPDLETIRKSMNDQLELKTRINQLKSMIGTPPTHALEALKEELLFIKQQDDYNNAQAWLKSHPSRPRFTNEDLDLLQEKKESYQLFKRRQELSLHISIHKDKHTQVCPSCGHEWDSDKQILEKLENELKSLPVPKHDCKEPIGTDIPFERKRIEEFEALRETYEKMEKIKAPIRRPFIPEQTVRSEIAKYEHLEKYNELRALEQRNKLVPDYERQYQERLIFDKLIQQYETLSSLYQEQISLKRQDERDLENIEKQLATLGDVKTLYVNARIYETQMEKYSSEMEKYEELLKSITIHEEEASEWRKVKQGLNDFRVRVKQYLVPSLNTVASSVISQMTGGQRQSVIVNEDFDVTIDGQPLHTLSGSGKAVANLSLRIGLGRVLTNNVFSVFIGDEIDGWMDKNREETTAKTMRNLGKSISQVLLVTHKYPEADYYIELGNDR